MFTQNSGSTLFVFQNAKNKGLKYSSPFFRSFFRITTICLIQFNSFYYLNSSCNKIVNKYAQPLHVYRLLQCFLSQFIIFLKVLLRWFPGRISPFQVLIRFLLSLFFSPFDVLCFVFSLLRWFPGRISPFQVLIRFLLSLLFSPFVISLFVFLFVLLSCSVCIIPRLCDSFNR